MRSPLMAILLAAALSGAVQAQQPQTVVPQRAAPRDLDENTAGAGTEAAKDQELYGTARRPEQPPHDRLAPPNWEQVGESQPSADLDAAAAERAEPEPSSTLGVNTVPAEVNPAQAQGKPSETGKVPAPPPDAGMSTRNPTASTIKPATGSAADSEQHSRP